MSTDVMETTQQRLFEEEGADAVLATPEPEAIRKIRDKFEGIVISVSKGPQSKQLTHAQKASAVKDVGASTDAITMGKRLFDKRVIRRVEELRRVNEIFGEIDQMKTDKAYTLPHPDPGVRLVRKGDNGLDRMAGFVSKFESLQARLAAATLKLRDVWDKVKEVASQELGGYYDEEDYAFDPHATMTATYKFVEVGVPSYLRHNTKLYEREEARVRAEMEMVKNMKEAEMAEAMFEIVDRIVERLENRQLLDDTHEVLEVIEDKDTVTVRYQPSGTSAKSSRKEVEMTKDEFKHRVKADRKPKTFRDASVAQLFEGLEHAQEMFDELALGDGRMAEAFDKLRGVIKGQDASSLAGALRGSESYRESIRERLAKISEHMIDNIIDKPRRVVMRKRQRQNRKQD